MQTAANYIAVSDIQAYNPSLDLSLYSQTTLSGIVTRASAWVDNYLGYTLMYETITDEKAEGLIDADGNLVIFPAKRPIDTVSALSVGRGNVELTLELNSGADPRYDIIPSWKKSQIIYPNNQLSVTGSVRINTFYELRNTRFMTKITYSAGYQTIPTDIQDAVGLICADMVSRNNNPSGATSVSQGQVSYSFADRSSGDSDKIRDAKQILSSYKRISGF